MELLCAIRQFHEEHDLDHAVGLQNQTAGMLQVKVRVVASKVNESVASRAAVPADLIGSGCVCRRRLDCDDDPCHAIHSFECGRWRAGSSGAGHKPRTGSSRVPGYPWRPALTGRRDDRIAGHEMPHRGHGSAVRSQNSIHLPSHAPPIPRDHRTFRSCISLQVR